MLNAEADSGQNQTDSLVELGCRLPLNLKDGELITVLSKEPEHKKETREASSIIPVCCWGEAEVKASEASRGFCFWDGQCLITVTEGRGAWGIHRALAQRESEREGSIATHAGTPVLPPHVYKTLPGPACAGLAIFSAQKWNVGQGREERWWLGYRGELLSVEGHWHDVMWTPLGPVPMTRATLLYVPHLAGSIPYL